MKEFFIRKHLKNPIRTFLYCLTYVVTFFIVFAIIVNLSPNVSKSFIEKFNYIYFSFILFVIAFVSSLFSLLYYFYFRKLKYISVILDDNGIIYSSLNKKTVISYDEISEVDCSHFKYSRGWIKIKGKDKVIKLTVTLENIAVFIKEFKERIDEKCLDEKYNSKRMYDFYKTASYSDDSWERIYELLKFVPPATGFGIVISFIFSFLVKEIDIKFVIILLTFIFPELVLLLSEIILVIKHTIDMQNEKYIIRMRDYQYEHRVFDAVFVLLLIIISILLFYFGMKY